MSVVRLNFEDGYPGSTVRGGPISGLSRAGGGGAIVYDTSTAQWGSQSVKMTVATAATGVLEMNSFSTNQLALDLAFRTQEVLAQDATVVSVHDASYGLMFKLYASATNKFVLQNGAGQVVYTSTQSIPTNQWLRFSFFCKNGATTGSLKFNYYLDKSITPVETGYSKVGNESMRASPIGLILMGKTLGNSTHAGTLWIDAVQYDFDATDVLPPWPTSSAMVWTGSQWEKHKPHMWNGTTWVDHGSLF